MYESFIYLETIRFMTVLLKDRLSASAVRCFRRTFYEDRLFMVTSHHLDIALLLRANRKKFTEFSLKRNTSKTTKQFRKTGNKI